MTSTSNIDGFDDPLTSMLRDSSLYDNGLVEIEESSLTIDGFAIDDDNEDENEKDNSNNDNNSIPVTINNNDFISNNVVSNDIEISDETSGLIVEEITSEKGPSPGGGSIGGPTVASSSGGNDSLFNTLAGSTATAFGAFKSKIHSAVNNHNNLNPNIHGGGSGVANPVPSPMSMNRSIPTTTITEIKQAPDAITIQSMIESAIGCPLISGERVIMFLTNIASASDSSTPNYMFDAETGEKKWEWCLAMTFYRIVLFTPYHTSSSSSVTNSPPPTHIMSVQEQQKYYWKYYRTIQTPLGCIDKVEKNDEHFTVTISTKLGRWLQYTTSSLQDCLRSYEALMTYSFPGRRNLGYLFAFEARRSDVLQRIAQPTKRRFSASMEYERLGVHPSHPTWKMCLLNEEYHICESYPSHVIVPASLLTDEQQNRRKGHIISRAASFRSGNRFPALSWGNAHDAASIWRCAQPKVGLQSNRSSSDEMFLKSIAESVVPFVKPRDNTTFLKIFDLRSKTSAMANRTSGYGYENVGNYPYASIQFWNISNIHSVRDAFTKLIQLCITHSSSSSTDINWLSNVEDTKWLQSIRYIFIASISTVYTVHKERLPVLLHCSHGWDRTSQVSALAQLMLDSYYRTIEGFASLITKEFHSFGHPFHLRSAHGEMRSSSTGTISSNIDGSNQTSPILLQFLDCVYQLINLFPNYFEYTSRYLIVLADHIYSCRFGTFLCDNEKERECVANVRARTDCVWDYLDELGGLVKNPFYEKYNQVLLPPTSMVLRSITLWNDFFCRYTPKPLVPNYKPDILQQILQSLKLQDDNNEDDYEKVSLSTTTDATEENTIAESKNATSAATCHELTFFCKEDVQIHEQLFKFKEYESKLAQQQQEIQNLKNYNNRSN